MTLKETVSVSGGTGSYTTKTIRGKIIGFSIMSASAGTTYKFYLQDRHGFRWINQATTVTHGHTYLGFPIQCVGPMTFVLTSVSVDEDFQIEVMLDDNAVMYGVRP